LSFRRAQYRADRAGVKADQPQRQRDQLIQPRRDIGEHKPLQNRHIAAQKRMVRGQVSRIKKIHARRIDADEPYALPMKEFD